jgi:uncharacterized damage-inducible protein DinB
MGITIRRPTDKEFASFYAGYIGLVPDGDLLHTLEQQMRDTQALLRPIGEDKSRFRYAAGKWSVRDVVGHMADSERVFTYRALRFARRDATPLPGYDEKAWGEGSSAHSRTLASLLDDFQTLRAATLSLFRGFSEEEWGRAGTANNVAITVRALGYVVAGHERHHVKILTERYLTP